MNIYKKYLITLALFLITANLSLSQTLFREDFGYPAAPDLEGTGGWYHTGTQNINNISVKTPGLSYTGYAGSNIGNAAYIQNVYPGDILHHDFATQTSGSIYYSFMIRVDSLGGDSNFGYVTGLDQDASGTNFNSELYIHMLSFTTFRFGFLGRPGEPDTLINGTYNTGITYLVVIKYKFVPGDNNDSTSIFLYTGGPIPANEGAPSLRRRNTSSGYDMVNESRVMLNSATIGSMLAGTKVRIDGIRVGKSWATSVLSSVEQTSNEVPSAYHLDQNFPNPFNPKTIINYQCSMFNYVTLKVYDILGNEVATLVNGEQNPGSYRVEWDAANYPSGVYFYRLQAEGINETRQMMLLK